MYYYSLMSLSLSQGLVRCRSYLSGSLVSMGIKTRAADPVYKLCYFLVHRIEQPKGIIILFHSFLFKWKYSEKWSITIPDWLCKPRVIIFLWNFQQLNFFSVGGLLFFWRKYLRFKQFIFWILFCLFLKFSFNLT